MKAGILILGLLMCLPNIAHADESCAGGNGVVIKGLDNKSSYCLSKIKLNWWSASAWCDTLGLELVDIQKDCNTIAGTTQCPNLAVGNIALEYNCVWTKNIHSSNQMYCIELQTGKVSSSYKNAASIPTLCRQ